MKDVLRFITCGAVGDGKSTLIGSLLHGSEQIFEDRHADLHTITSDVVYRFFSSTVRKFIVADTPGHDQNTHDLATRAADAQLAVILVDARRGVLTQTRLHSRIVSMFGVRDVVLAVNKMDAVGWDQSVFEQIRDEYYAFAQSFGFATIASIPLCALTAANVATRAEEMSWYTGPALLPYLNDVDIDRNGDVAAAGCMPIQHVDRPNPAFRGFYGRIALGSLRAGECIRVVPGGVESRIKSIMLGFDSAEVANTGDAVTLALEDEVDISCGDVICAASSPLQATDQFEAKLLWMADRPLVPGRSYILKMHTKDVGASVSAIKYRLDVNTGAHLAAKQLAMNDIGVVNVSLDCNVAFSPYAESRRLGAFILNDRLTNETAGAGIIDFALRRASNIHWQKLTVDQMARARIKQQTPRCIWLTGLSGSGKSTIANLLEKKLHDEGLHTFLLDGDNVRHGLNRDLGFTEADRVENLRRVAEVAKLMVQAGLVVIVSFISPFHSERAFARSLFAKGDFIEVFVDTPLAECERRDPKGLYAKARAGQLINFTGIDSPYEPPEHAEIVLPTAASDPAECAQRLYSAIGALR